MEKHKPLLLRSKQDQDTRDDLAFLQSNQIDKIYNKYCDALYLYGQSFTSDLSLVEDALQDVFVWLLNHHNKIQIHTSLKLYLFKVYRHTILALLKKTKIREVREVEFGRTLKLRTEFRDSDRSMMEKLKNAILQLSSRQYEIVMLKYIHDYSYEQIAEVMEISVDSAYNLNHRSIEKLRILVG